MLGAICRDSQARGCAHPGYLEISHGPAFRLGISDGLGLELLPHASLVECSTGSPDHGPGLLGLCLGYERTAKEALEGRLCFLRALGNPRTVVRCVVGLAPTAGSQHHEKRQARDHSSHVATIARRPGRVVGLGPPGFDRQPAKPARRGRLSDNVFGAGPRRSAAAGCQPTQDQQSGPAREANQG